MSVLAPRLTEPFSTAVPSVMVSVPVPPISVLTLLTVPVLPPLARVSLLVPRAEIDRMRWSARVPSVMVSLPPVRR